MSKTRLTALFLTLMLAFAATPAVLADSHDLDAEDVAGAEEWTPESGGATEWNEDEALILYTQFKEALGAMGVAEEDTADAVEYLDGVAGQSEEDEPEMGDDEFADEGEPELGDGE
jgi:hypothetical protein